VNGLGYWEADGRSARADTELVQRLELLMIKRDRSVIWRDTPPKTRQVIYLDVGANDDADAIVKKLHNERDLYKALERTLEFKTDFICERVLEELMLGEKTIVWVLTRASVEIMARALEKACAARDVVTRLREANCRIWATHGEADVKARFEMAATYRSHQGAGVLIATMDSLPESISLFGASTEHYGQLHYLSGPMEQSENRPYLKNTSKLHIFYYIARHTVDERIVNLVLPRLAAADKIGSSKDAASQALALKDKTEEDINAFIERLTRSAPENAQADIFDADTEFLQD
jgi:hypothetical protein